MTVTARIERDGFTREEAFKSKADAKHWREMVEATLELPASAGLNMHVYAAGLADSVRAYGGRRTRDAWLTNEAPAEEWAKGRPVKVDIEAMMRAVLAGKRIR
jgi:hypothetical protein